MSKALKGALLSGLGFPGLGQMVMRHYLRGVVLALAFSTGLTMVTIKAVRATMDIIEKSGAATGNLDINQMLNTTQRAMADADTLGYKLAVLLIVSTWIIGIADAFLLGRRLDLQAALVSSRRNERQ